MSFRYLLLIQPLGLLLATPADSCETPEQYTHRSVLGENDLVITLATDKEVYFAGEPIQFYLRVDNQGPDTVRLSSGVNPLNIFGVMQNDCVSLEGECIEVALFYYPQIVTYYGESIVIHPGGCAVRGGVWDGWLWEWDPDKREPVLFLPPPGDYTVLGGIYLPVAEPPERDFVIPEDGATLPISITLPTGNTPVTWGQLRTKYGQE